MAGVYTGNETDFYVNMVYDLEGWGGGGGTIIIKLVVYTHGAK